MEETNRRKGPPPWHYHCRECGQEFRVRAPRGPAEESRIACPNCRSRRIERTDMSEAEACQPGG
jgi:DNA-directed RNA polymerase subunit RPC12/RpoP